MEKITYESEPNKPELAEWILILLYQLVIIFGILQVSMYKYYLTGGWMNKVVLISAALMVVMATFFFKRSLDQWLVFLIFTLFAALNFQKTGNTQYLLFISVVFGFSGIKNKKVFQVSLCTSIALIFFIFLMSKLGFIDNLSYIRGGYMRQSFGLIYPLTFSSYIFFICCLFVVSVDKINSYVEAAILVGTALLVLRYTNSRNDALSIILLALALLINKLHPIIKEKLINIGILIMPIVAFFSVFVSKIISNNSPLRGIVNSIASDRLYLQDELFNYFSPKLFGQVIAENGNGGLEGKNVILGYFYIDSSYTRIFFLGGILIFIVYVLIWMRGVRKQKLNSNYLISFILFIIWINGITQDNAQNAIFDFMMPILFMDNLKISKSKEMAKLDKKNSLENYV